MKFSSRRCLLLTIGCVIYFLSFRTVLLAGSIAAHERSDILIPRGILASMRPQQGKQSRRRSRTYLPPTSKCHPLIQQRKGIYNSTTAPPSRRRESDKKFENVVLMTAVNHQFEHFLRNWEMIARDWGLKWAVLSLDNSIYETLGGQNHSILLPLEGQVERAGKFRTASYNKLVCNKVRMVLEILQECNVEIVFSDVDNVFLKDPFQHDLGHMIGCYDYIYQTNHEWTNQARNHTCITEGLSAEEGNTGFHYLRPSENMKNVLAETLRRCDEPGNGIDDQTLLWDVLREGIDQKVWKHCPPYAVQAPSENSDASVSQLCCLDPHYYPIGKKQPQDPSVLVALHVNYGARTKKKGKLKRWVSNGWRLPWG